MCILLLKKFNNFNSTYQKIRNRKPKYVIWGMWNYVLHSFLVPQPLLCNIFETGREVARNARRSKILILLNCHAQCQNDYQNFMSSVSTFFQLQLWFQDFFFSLKLFHFLRLIKESVWIISGYNCLLSHQLCKNTTSNCWLDIDLDCVIESNQNFDVKKKVMRLKLNAEYMVII